MVSDSLQKLKSKIIFTLLALVVFRIGTYIPIPGVNVVNVAKMSEATNGILGMLNVFSGGALGRLTIFSLNVIPYITASIVMQLLSASIKYFEDLKKSSDSGRQKINLYTKILCIVLAALQATGISFGILRYNQQVQGIIMNPGMFFVLVSVCSIVTGTIFLVWLGEQITAKGIGNGISLIIFIGIISELPKAIVQIFELGRVGTLSTFFIICIIIGVIALLALVVFVERTYRKVRIHYPRRQMSRNSIAQERTSFLPLKINMAGVIPPIFASSLLLFPATILSFSSQQDMNPITSFIALYLVQGKPLFIIMYVLLIMFFCFFYTGVVFSSKDIANNLKQAGGFVQGVRPGKKTEEYFDNIVGKLTMIGALYISFVALLPELFTAKFSLPFYFGGTGIIIIVNVVIDTMTQIQTFFISNSYKKLMNKAKLKKS